MAKIGLFKTYHFVDHDPIIDKVDTILDDEGTSLTDAAHDSGVSRSTLVNWRKRKTKRPQYATIAAVVRSQGYDFVLAKVSRSEQGGGNVVELPSRMSSRGATIIKTPRNSKRAAG